MDAGTSRLFALVECTIFQLPLPLSNLINDRRIANLRILSQQKRLAENNRQNVVAFEWKKDVAGAGVG